MTLPGCPPPSTPRPRWQRGLWLAAGALALALGLVGVVLPILPTTPFVLLAAWCFSRGSARWEAWLLAHPRLGPLVLQWRTQRAVPRRAKQLAWLMMAASCAFALWQAPPPWGWLPLPICLVVGLWLWRLPDAR